MMRILIAPDAFKGSLTSGEAACAMAAGIRSIMSEAEVYTMPLADGGEGILDVVFSHCNGKVRNDILYFDDHDAPCCLIESARLIGLTLPDMQADVFERGSAKLGLAVLEVLDAGVRDIRIGLGGSATVDGGLGLLMALGCRVFDQHGTQVSPDLQGMMHARRIETGDMDQRLAHARITALCDVRNRLCSDQLCSDQLCSDRLCSDRDSGDQGAVLMYGAQKGIETESLSVIETAMQHWGELCEQAFGSSVMHAPGSGAAGGLGFALQLLGAQIVSGAEYVMRACGFDPLLKTVDWLVTGEGKSDAQTLHGKLPAMVAGKARDDGVKTALISGLVTDRAAMEQVFDMVLAATPPDYPLNRAMLNAATLLRQASAAWADTILQAQRR